MRREPRFRDGFVGRGLAIAAIATLAAAALLVTGGLVWEVSLLRTTVLSEARTAAAYQLVSQASGAEPGPSQGRAGQTGAVTASATTGDHPHESDLAAEGETVDEETADPGSDTPTAADRGSGDGSPVVAGAPVPNPEGAVAREPSPARPVARTRPEPGPRGPPRASADAPIVMFHYIGPLPANADIFRKDLTVSESLFDGVLQYLADQEAVTVSMDDLMEHYAGGPELPKKSVILTFDDGYDGMYDYAFPMLKQRGMVGTFFIITDFVGRPGYLTWGQIAEMDAAGMSFGAHSLTHPDFTKIGPAELRRQLIDPKQVLEEHLGHPIRFLAYPSGKYNAATIVASKAAGYVAAVTVIHGLTHPASSAFELTRVRAHGADTVPALTARLTPPSWRR